MAIPTCSAEELEKLIKQSGYPFELKVAEALQSQGFQVQLSQHFFNPFKEKDSELDILAIKPILGSTKSVPKMRLIFELAIECKDNSLPFVLFGFPSRPKEPEEDFDADCRYVNVRSTIDTIPNTLAMVAFGDIRDSNPKNLKPELHQFKGEHRFHHAVLVECEKDKFKLHESERLRSALVGLIGYSEHLFDTWKTTNNALKNMSHDPIMWITFYLLVHKGEHYQYTNKNKLELAKHTTLFTSSHSDDKTGMIAIDFVQFDELPAALKRIEQSFSVLAKHLGRYMGPMNKHG